jgi:hypothetical protein
MGLLIALFTLSFALLAEGSPDGEWTWKMASPFGELNAKAVMKAEGGKLTGAFWLSETRKLEIENGTVDGDKIKFTLKRERPSGGSMTYEMTGTVKGDAIEGSANAVEMSATNKWSATRKK